MDRSGHTELSRCAQLNQLNAEIRRLFDQGLEEAEMVNSLMSSNRFGRLRRSTISSHFRFLCKQRDKMNIKKEKVTFGDLEFVAF